MPTEIDSLQIKIQADAVKANDAIDRLDDKLERLEKALSGLERANLTGFAHGVERLSKAMGSMNQVKTADFTRLTKNLANLSTVNVAGLNSSASSVITLSKAFNELSTATQNANNISIFASALSKLGNKGVQNAIVNIPQLSKAMSELLNSLASAPQVSKSVVDVTNALANLASQSTKVGRASTTMVSGLNRTTTAMARTRSQATSLASAFGKFYASYFMIIRGVKGLWSAIEDSMDYVETYNYFNVALGKIGEETAERFGEFGKQSAENYAKEFGDRLNELNKKMTGYIVDDEGALQLAGDMGLGLNIQQMMNFQAKVLSVTNSVGLMGEASVSTAKAVSMLAGDISSLTNVDIESVMESLTSGLIGQSRALYKYGIDITNNTLQQYAYAEGIEKAVSEMTQSEKMQLRLLAILDQSEVAWGDLGHTVDSVANQYRIFQQQVGNLGRTFGNLFLPIVKNVLPYVNGLVIALNNLFTSLGFSIYGDTWLEDLQDGIGGGLQSDIEDLEEGMEDTADAANKLKKSLSSFDELDVISTNAFSLQSGNNLIDLTKSIADALTDYENKWNEAFTNSKNKATEFAEAIEKSLKGVFEVGEDLIPVIEGIGTAFVTYKVIGGFSSLLSALSVLATPAGIAAVAVGVLAGVAIEVGKINKELKEEDLEKRFGNIALNLEEIEEIASYILDNKNLEEVSNLLSELDDLSGVETSISNSIKELEKMNWKVSVGMELTEGEEEQYKSAIASYISDVKSYVTNQHYAVHLGLELFLENEETSGNIKSVVDEFYNSQYAKLEELGKKLNEVTTNAWNDGLLTIDEVETITSIQQQMASIQEKLATSELQARMQLLEMDFSGAELTPESYEALTKKRNELFKQYEEELNESTVFTLSQINVAYQAKIDEATTKEEIEKIQEEWDKAVEEVTKSKNYKVLEMSLKSLAFDFNTLADTYGKEIEDSFGNGFEKLSYYAKKFGEGDTSANLLFDMFFGNVTEGFEEAVGEIESENFKELLGSIFSENDVESVAQNLYETTGQIPESVASALASRYALEAISGNAEAMFKLLVLSSDSKDVKEVLKSAKQRGYEIPEYLANGISGNKDFAEQSLTDLLSGFKTALSDGSLAIEAENAGKDVASSFLEGVSGISKFGFGLTPLFINKTGIQGFATGGFPEDGLFMANHNELVGKFSNGKTAVANNQQIIEGIKQGVFEAVTAAMQGNNSNNSDIVINMDGREVFKVVRNRANEYYNVNGRPAFNM